MASNRPSHCVQSEFLSLSTSTPMLLSMLIAMLCISSEGSIQILFFHFPILLCVRMWVKPHKGIIITTTRLDAKSNKAIKHSKPDRSVSSGMGEEKQALPFLFFSFLVLVGAAPFIVLGIEKGPFLGSSRRKWLHFKVTQPPRPLPVGCGECRSGT